MSSDMRPEPEAASDQVAALSKAVISIDGARRVGWAKAFSAIRQLESVSCDFNIADTDRKLYREKFSYLWGFFREYIELFGAPGSVALKEILHKLGADSLAEFHSNGVIEPNQAWAGRELARNLIDKSAGLVDDDNSSPDEVLQKLAQQRLRKKQNKNRSPEESERQEEMFQAAKKRAMYELAEEFGYSSIRHLRRGLHRASRKRAADHDKFFDAAKRKALDELVAELGFSDVQQLRSALRSYRTITNTATGTDSDDGGAS